MSNIHRYIAVGLTMLLVGLCIVLNWLAPVFGCMGIAAIGGVVIIIVNLLYSEGEG